MASLLIETKLSKTAEYINSDDVNAERAGHHNYVVEQEICSLNPCLDNMTPAQIENFDTKMVEYLRNIDIKH